MFYPLSFRPWLCFGPNNPGNNAGAGDRAGAWAGNRWGKEAQDMRDLRRRFGRGSGRGRRFGGDGRLGGGVGALELIIGVLAVLVVIVFLLQLID